MKKIRLTPGSLFSFFIVSYLPMFFIMIFRQLYMYSDYLNWGGLSSKSISVFAKYFGAITVLIIIAFISCIGILIFLNNIKRRTINSGDPVKVVDLENKNNESITYLFTYLIPFVFQDLSDIPNIVAIFVLLSVTYFIYANSTLILINPTLSIKYSLFLIEYSEGNALDNKNRKAMFLIKDRDIDVNDIIITKKIGYKLFYAEKQEDSNAEQ